MGKSGAGTCSISSSTVMSGFPTSASKAPITSPRLCGGMEVAIPTAIPALPFTSRLGTRDGRTRGSWSEPS